MGTNKDDKRDVKSVKLLNGGSNTDDNTVCYLERPVYKLVMLIKSNGLNINILLVRFLAEKSLLYHSQDVLRTS